MSKPVKSWQPELLVDGRPATAKVDGEGFLTWCRDPQVHVYRVDCPKAGTYVVHLLWLDGRELIDGRLKNAVAAKSVMAPAAPMRGQQARFQAVKQSLMAFGKEKA